jgi:hypothetical protein
LLCGEIFAEPLAGARHPGPLVFEIGGGTRPDAGGAASRRRGAGVARF